MRRNIYSVLTDSAILSLHTKPKNIIYKEMQRLYRLLKISEQRKIGQELILNILEHNRTKFCHACSILLQLFDTLNFQAHFV